MEPSVSSCASERRPSLALRFGAMTMMIVFGVSFLVGAVHGQEKESLALFGPTLVWGKSMVAWTGYLLGLAFVANFWTCCVMPWRCHLLPWKGSKPGKDQRDPQGFLRLTTVHEPLAWSTILLGTLHGILGIFQSFGIIL